MEGRRRCRILSFMCLYLEIWDSFKRPSSSIIIFLCRSTWYFIAGRAYLCFNALQNNKYNSYFMPMVLFLREEDTCLSEAAQLSENLGYKRLSTSVYAFVYYGEYKIRNRHNVGWFFTVCLYISAGQTSLFQVQWEFYIANRFYLMFLPGCSDHRDQFFCCFELKKLSWRCG